MEEEFIGAMTPETEKKLSAKLKFKNKALEIVDDYAVRLLDNRLLDPLLKKLPEDVQLVVKAALAEVIEEMPEIEI